MPACCDPDGYARLFDDKNARRDAQQYLKRGLDRTATAVNVELVHTYERPARELLETVGLTDRVGRKVLDFARDGG